MSSFIKQFSFFTVASLLAGSSFALAVPRNPPFVRSLKETFLNDPKKKTVCTITINSDNEKNLFLKHLGEKNFNFIELVPEREDDAFKSPNPNWFKDSCDTQVQCDLLVVSGHFGGSFFGDSQYLLPLEELETRSCSRDCDGVLHRPREVFLFGCNTLAGKGVDARTPEEYIDVLVHDGFSREQATQIADDRYGVFGVDNRSRMQGVFAGVPHLYGFDARGPSGNTVAPILNQYLNQTDYKKRLEKMPLQPNADLETVMKTWKATSFTQCSGLSGKDPFYAYYLKLCRINNEKNSLDDRILAIQEILTSSKPMVVVPTAANFIFQHGKDPRVKQLLSQIQADQALKPVNPLNTSQSHFQ
jgi:hypothetical protein